MLDGSGSFDAEQDNNPLSYAWDLDEDGQFDDATGIQPDFSAAGLDGPDFYLIGLQVTDVGGLTDEDFSTLTVNNVAPQVEAGADLTAVIGSAVSFAGAFTDQGVPDTHTILWDFGDGEMASDTLTPTHVFEALGMFTVTLTVTDDDDDAGLDTLVVTVGEAFEYLPVVLKP
jgi:PKD repeat protein